MSIQLRTVFLIGMGLLAKTVFPQAKADTVLTDASLPVCVQYALTHQPLVQQSVLDEAITEKQIRTKLADWYPQLNFAYNYQHNFELPVSYFSNNYVRNGTWNTSTLGLNLTQNIFNRDALFASRTSGDVRLQAKQNTSLSKIDIAVNVSKAFYDVLLTRQQIAVLNQAITRLDKSLKDAVSQYKTGVADKIDYKRATIALNNAKAQKKQTTDLIDAKLSYLKEWMGLDAKSTIELSYDTGRLEKEAELDTNVAVQYENRIEYRQLQTQQRLQEANIKYYKAGFIPNISAFGNYNTAFLNNDFAKTYNNGFANSNIGIQLSLPIFQGNKRIYQIRQAELQSKRVQWDLTLLQSRVNTQYAQALALYKANLASFASLKENRLLAEDVYQTLTLQYQSGIKTYLDVIIAESDLRTTQLNYYNALFQLMQSKLDVQKALGTITY